MNYEELDETITARQSRSGWIINKDFCVVPSTKIEKTIISSE